MRTEILCAAALSGLQMAWDGLNQRLMLMATASEAWFYRYRAIWSDEACTNGVDDDGDAQVDCADPDCEGRPSAAGQTCAGGTCQ